MFKPSTRHQRSLLASAALAALAAPALAADYTWTTGFFAPGTTAPSPLLAGDQLNIASGGFKFFSAVNFSNQGTVNWLADPLYLQSGAIVDNAGLWDSKADTSMLYNGGASPSFLNSGTFRKSAGTGSTVIAAGTGFVNSGTLDAQVGTLRFDGGSVFNAGSSFTGGGRVEMATGTHTFNGGFSSANLVLAGGTFDGAGAAIGGAVSWTGGRFNGGWKVGSGQTLNAGAGSFKFISGAGTVLTNEGTLAWNTDNWLYMESGATLSNKSLFVANADTTLAYNGGAQTSFDNTAAGTLRAAAGRTLTIGSLGFVNNGGILDAQAGATLQHTGNNSVFNDGTRFTGAGRNLVSSNATFNGGFTSANLVLGGGAWAGNAAVMGGTVSWTGGRFNGGWTVGAGQTLNADTGGFKFVSGAGTVLANEGTVVWSTGDWLYMESGATLANKSLFVANADTTLAYNGGAQTSFVNTATGTLRAAAGRTLSVGSLGFVNNGGILDAQAGATLQHTGNNSVFNDGTRFTGAGRNLVSSNATFNGGFQSANLVLGAGTWAGNAAVMGGTVSLTGGRFNGSWTVGAGQALNVGSGGFKFVSGAGTVLANEGSVAWNTSDWLYMESGGALVNRGVWDFTADASIVYNGGAAPSVVNEGLIVKTAGTGTTAIGNSLGFDNLGTVDVRSGTIRLPTNFVNNGLLTGSGTIEVAGTLSNAGHVAPGASPGTLSLSGSFAQTAAGVFDVELNTLGATDLLNITGSAALGGTLALHCWAACSLAVGDQIVILDAAGDLSGGFAAMTMSGFGSGAFSVVYDTVGDRVLLQVTQAVTAVPEPGTAALWLAGLGVLGWFARRRY